MMRSLCWSEDDIAVAATASVLPERLMEDVRGFKINVLQRFGHVMYGFATMSSIKWVYFSFKKMSMDKPYKTWTVVWATVFIYLAVKFP